MRLPFGLDFKTAIVTILIMYFVLPWVLSFVGGMRKGNSKAE
jgi:antibiotic biosynthesis monooxygenase (ABM) superfamily enzyme